MEPWLHRIGQAPYICAMPQAKSEMIIFFPFPNIIFLLIIWEFHTMYPNHTRFPFLPGLPSHPCDLSSPP